LLPGHVRDLPVRDPDAQQGADPQPAAAKLHRASFERSYCDLSLGGVHAKQRVDADAPLAVKGAFLADVEQYQLVAERTRQPRGHRFCVY
jgi:hypothetical protein